VAAAIDLRVCETMLLSLARIGECKGGNEGGDGGRGREPGSS
jgi:hypothetical protein